MHGLLHLGVGTGGGAASSGQEKGRARRIPIQTQLVNELALGGFTFPHKHFVLHIDRPKGRRLQPVLAQSGLGLQRATNVIGLTRPGEPGGGEILHKA